MIFTYGVINTFLVISFALIYSHQTDSSLGSAISSRTYTYITTRKCNATSVLAFTRVPSAGAAAQVILELLAT